MTSSRRAAIAAVLGLAAAGVHLGALGCGFIAYDDDAYVYQNPHLRDGFAADSVRWAFTAHLTHDALPHLDYWQPLTVLSRLLDVELFGLDPRGHHATNLLLHGLNASLLFLVLEAMTGAGWRSAFVAAVFAMHPLRVESVVWVTERKDVLSGLFWMLTLAAYLRYVRRPRRPEYAALLAVFVLGLMAKPVLVTLPFVLLLLDCWPLRRLSLEDGRSFARPIVEKLPLFLLAFASVAITVFSQARASILVTLGTQPFAVRAGNAVVDYVRYAAKLAWPPPMALPQPYPLEPWPPWMVAACAAALLLVSAAALRRIRPQPYLAVGWLWFVGTLMPVIGLVQSGAQPMADRFTYIPHIGLAIAVTWGLADAFARWPARAAWVAAAAVVVLAAFAATTVAQTRHWRDSASLFRHGVEATANNYAAHFNLGNALAGQGRHAEASAHYRETIAIKPDHARAHNNLANLIVAQGRTDEAIRHYEEALRLVPAYVDAHNNLGLLLFGRNENSEARRHYLEALRSRPRHVGALHNLGRLEAREARVPEALEVLAAAIDADPAFAPAYATRGTVLARAGRLGEAEADFRSALRLRPSDAESRNNLGRALALQGRADEAMIEYEAAAGIAPEHPLVHVNIGRLLLAQGRPGEALLRFQEALRLRPRDAEAHFELGQAMAHLGRGASACAEYQQALRLDPGMEEARSALRAGRCPPRGTD
jgi:Flp pilus assembly protein TadD